MLGRCAGRIAQLVEHLPYKQVVAGSSPAAPTAAPTGAAEGQRPFLAMTESAR